MKYRSPDPKIQRPLNRQKIPMKPNQQKIDEILSKKIPGIHNFDEPRSPRLNHLPKIEDQYRPNSSRNNRNSKLPQLVPLDSPPQHRIQVPSVQQLQSNQLTKKLNIIDTIRDDSFEPSTPPQVDKFTLSIDLNDFDDSDSCAIPENHKTPLVQNVPRSNSVDAFNLTGPSILDDFFQSNSDEYDEIMSDDDDGIASGNKIDSLKKSRYVFLKTQELAKMTDIPTLHEELKSRIDKLLKIARNHFPATKDNTTMLTRLVEQSQACHEFHFLEKRTKYYESENRGLSIALSSLEEILKNPQSSNRAQAKYAVTRLNALQVRQAKRMEKELMQAEKKIKKYKMELEKVREEMKQAIQTRKGGDGSFLIAEIANIDNCNDDESMQLAALRVEHQFSLAKEKAAVGVLQNEVDELERVVNKVDKRIILMTQKKSNYSELFTEQEGNNKHSTSSTPKSKSCSQSKSPTNEQKAKSESSDLKVSPPKRSSPQQSKSKAKAVPDKQEKKQPRSDFKKKKASSTKAKEPEEEMEIEILTV